MSTVQLSDNLNGKKSNALHIVLLKRDQIAYVNQQRLKSALKSVHRTRWIVGLVYIQACKVIS